MLTAKVFLARNYLRLPSFSYFSRNEEEIQNLTIRSDSDSSMDEGEDETPRQRSQRLQREEDALQDEENEAVVEAARQLYDGTLDAPDTSPRWRQANIMFRQDDASSHPNDKEDSNILQTFYGYSKAREEVYDITYDLLTQRIEDGDIYSDNNLNAIREMYAELPHLLVDKGCEVLSLVGYHKKALEPSEMVEAYVRQQVDDLMAVSTGVEARTDVYAAVSVLLVGDASLTKTLVVHATSHMLQNIDHYADWCRERYGPRNVGETLHAIRDALVPAETKYLSPVTLQALADVLGCNISCLAGAPTAAQTDPHCQILRQEFKTNMAIPQAQEDVRPSELAVLAYYNHEKPEREDDDDFVGRLVPLPFTCYGLVPTAFTDLVNRNLLSQRAFLREHRARFPDRVLGEQLEEEKRMFSNIPAVRGGNQSRPPLGAAVAGSYQQQGRASGGGAAADVSPERDIEGGGSLGASRVDSEAVAEEVGEQATDTDTEERGGGSEEEPFDPPYLYDPAWSKDQFLGHHEMMDIFRGFMSEEDTQVMEEKPMNPQPGAVYFCRRTKSMGGVDELPENLGAMTTAKGKGTRQTYHNFVDRTGGNRVYWRAKSAPHLPVPTCRDYRIGTESAFTEEEAKEQFYKVKKITAYHTNSKGQALRVMGYV